MSLHVRPRVNHLLIPAKQTILICRQKKLTPNIKLFMAHVKHIIEVENTIALNKNKIIVHLEKWKKVLNCLYRSSFFYQSFCPL